MPSFWFGLILQIIFCLELQWLPPMGSGTFKHMILPATTLALGTIASQVRMTRSSILDVVNMNYIRTARAKGAGEFRVVSDMSSGTRSCPSSPTGA